MRSTWATVSAIVALFREAQLNDGTVPFPLTADLEIYEYKPADFMFDGKCINPRIYVYFEKTNFEKPDGGVHDVGHSPMINIDFVVAEKAQFDTTTDEFEFSNSVAEAKMRTIVSQIYDALNHTEFLRLMNAKISVDISVAGEFRCSQLWCFSAEKLGTLPFVKSSKAISIFQMIFQPSITEVHRNNPGITYDGTTDLITPVRREEDYEAE